MIFERGERFKYEEPERPALSYANFSEYLRQQFLNSRNMFVGSSPSRPQSARPRSARPRSPSPGRARQEQQPYEAESNGELYVNDFEDFPETNFHEQDGNKPSFHADDLEDQAVQSPVRKKNGTKSKQNSETTWQGAPQGFIQKKSMRVVPSVQFMNNDTPGPGAYNVSGTLVKNSFNRVYSEPTFSNSQSISNQPSYLRSTTASGTKRLDVSQAAPLWNSRGAYFNRKKTNKMKRTANGGGGFPNSPQAKGNNTSYNPNSPFSTQNIYSSAKFNKTKGKKPIAGANTHKKIEELSLTAGVSGSPTLYGTRYPPTSDKLMKRWTSISHDSYPDHSKKGNHSTMLRSSKVL